MQIRCRTPRRPEASQSRHRVEPPARGGEERSGLRAARRCGQAKISRGSLLRKPERGERGRILPGRDYRRYCHRAFENRATRNFPSLGDAPHSATSQSLRSRWANSSAPLTSSKGSIRRAGNRVRITAQLVEASTRPSVWAERYDRQLEDVVAIQEEIARSIAQALRITLSPQEEKTMARKPTENPQAYEFYLRGRSYTRRENLDYGPADVRASDPVGPEFCSGTQRDCEPLRPHLRDSRAEPQVDRTRARRLRPCHGSRNPICRSF